MGFRIRIPHSDDARGFVILDHGYKSCFEIIQDATESLTAYYVGQNPAVLIWLPPHSFGVIEVEFNEVASTIGTHYRFHYEVFNSAQLHTGREELLEYFKKHDSIEIELPKVKLTNGPKMWEVHCPSGSGQMHLHSCPAGQHGACLEGTVGCESGGPG